MAAKGPGFLLLLGSSCKYNKKIVICHQLNSNYLLLSYWEVVSSAVRFVMMNVLGRFAGREIHLFDLLHKLDGPMVTQRNRHKQHRDKTVRQGGFSSISVTGITTNPAAWHG